MRRISTEEHFLIPEIRDRAEALDLPVPSLRGLQTPMGRMLTRKLLDIGKGRIAEMDTNGVDCQLLSLTTPGVQCFGREDACSLARVANDRLADAVKAFPGRFIGLTVIAPQDPNAAARELERGINQLGFHGAIINSHTAGEYLDEPKFSPILEAAQALNVPIYIHPRTPSADMVKPLAVFGMAAGWGFTVDAATHALRMIAGGVFDSFPKLQIILGHMGETLPFLMPRIDLCYEFEVRLTAVPRPLRYPPSHYLQNNFLITTSGMNFERQLRFTIDTLGPERILFAIDYPFIDTPSSIQAFDGIALSEAERFAIYEGNASRELRLGSQPQPTAE